MKGSINFKKVKKPFVLKLGFEKLIEELEKKHCEENVCRIEYFDTVVKNLSDRQKLMDGFLEKKEWEKYDEDIRQLMSVIFPRALMKNEIKVALVPFSSEVIYTSDRFNSIFGNTGEIEALEFWSTDEDIMYILMCKIILRLYYGEVLQADVKSVYEVKNKEGISKFYKSTYNVDFVTIKPIGKAAELNNTIVEELRNNTTDIKLWKKYFPPESWEISGVGIKSFVDVSHEEALSQIKNQLITNETQKNARESNAEVNALMGSLLNVSDLKTSFIMYDEVKEQFMKGRDGIESIALGELGSCNKENMLCSEGYDTIFKSKDDFVLSNLNSLSEDAYDIPFYRRLRDKGVKSYYLASMYYKDQLLGIIELASETPTALEPTQRVIMNKVKDLSINALRRMQEERENQLSSIIQKEFTSIHPSVEWKFRNEAELALEKEVEGGHYNFGKIRFRSLVALFGQSDISGSSHARNKAIASDLQTQMALVQDIITRLSEHISMPLLDSIMFQIGMINEKLSSDLAAGMEQEVIEFLRTRINPLFEEMKTRDAHLAAQIDDYFQQMGNNMEVIYNERKAYDDTVTMINAHLSTRLDTEQVEAQKIYPHFFERYKTDGVEHNMYIGQEMTPHIPYNKLYLDNLRLWQLKIICQLEIEHRQRMVDYPMQLHIASLIMVYSNPMAIRYRMDEKQFDIDGAYNARYEIIKKRIDKAYIKGTEERITQPGKIIIIYTQASDLDEYLNYISFLTYQGYIVGEAEQFDIQDLQGVVGLKGLRVCVNYDRNQTENTSREEKNEEREEVEV